MRAVTVITPTDLSDDFTIDEVTGKVSYSWEHMMVMYDGAIELWKYPKGSEFVRGMDGATLLSSITIV